ncbi:hypothetical protein ANRL1_01426 [Anaerolineae bacterium]|nr:hypothetical protein ANRL1_01426 [Anaerolineae bacterium]
MKPPCEWKTAIHKLRCTNCARLGGISKRVFPGIRLALIKVISFTRIQFSSFFLDKQIKLTLQLIKFLIHRGLFVR